MIDVIISGGFHQVYNEVIPDFQKENNIQINTSSGASEGNNPKTIQYQLRNGAQADVVILSWEGLQNLIEDGFIDHSFIYQLATVPLAAAVRKGSLKFDIHTEENFIKVVQQAGKVVAPASTSGIFVRDHIFKKLNFSDTVNLNLVSRGTEAAQILKDGDANLAIAPTSELINLEGIEIIDILPDSLQLIQTFTDARVKNCAHPHEAKALMKFLNSKSQKLSDSIRKFGMNPII